MGENDEEARGFLYYWVNDPKPATIKVIPCEVYSRIVGYVRPVQQWNEGKQQEWVDRVTYDLPVLRSPPTYDDTPIVVEVEVTP